MFGGLKGTTSRLAIAAAGLMIGGAVYATPAAADAWVGGGVGGNCCADLEERVAELEATTVRKGNKKVSVTLSGFVIKSMNVWDDGEESHFIVGDKDYDLGTRFAITGTATIAPGWSAGYNHTINTQGSVFGFSANQFDDTNVPLGHLNDADEYGVISTLYSYGFIKSDRYGTINIGHLSQASDNKAVLADLSGTLIESNAVFFEGPGFFLRPNGASDGSGNNFGLSGATWGNFTSCTNLAGGLRVGSIGADCFGAAQPAVRYDSPTFGGFSFQASYGYQSLTGDLDPNLLANDNDFADLALLYSKDWGNFKVSAAYTYTWVESAPGFAAPNGVAGPRSDSGDIHQVGASIMHTPTGLGIYGYYQNEDNDGRDFASGRAIPEGDSWYLKPFIKRTWTSYGATTFYGEYGEYNDQYSSILDDQCAVGPLGGGALGTNVNDFCSTGGLLNGNTLFVTGSEVQRYGLGVGQDIDAAAMHLWARWQHQELDVDLRGTTLAGNVGRVSQGFDDWDVYQVGGIINF